MPTIKRVWELTKEELPYVMDPRRFLSELSSRPAVRSANGYTLYHDIQYGNITRSNIVNGEYVALDFRPQYYVVDKQGQMEHFLPSSLEFRVQNILGISRGGGGGNSQKEEPEEKPDWWDEVKGAAKQVVNDVVRAQASSTAEWMQKEGIAEFKDKQGKTLTPEEVTKAYRDTGKEAFKILDNEQQGAVAVAALPAYPAVLLALDTALSRGKDLIRNPKEFSSDLQNALKEARSEAEALGNLGMEQAKKRLGHNDDSRYTNRYHGPDGITQDTNGKLSEWEAKGNQTSSRSVAEDVRGNKQGSKGKNIRRAEKMIQKQPKVDQPSNRQGGPYRQAEIDLWHNVSDKQGNKRHISSHTNTTTGETVVFERDLKGNISSELDRFNIESFKEAKEAIQEVFK
ncbi:hypothetical protein [Neptuniibacter sp. QD57_21]